MGQSDKDMIALLLFSSITVVSCEKIKTLSDVSVGRWHRSDPLYLQST
jgi:hypothetical protein